MSETSLRFYNTSVSYNNTQRLRRIEDMKKRFRTRISRRRARQAMSSMLRRVSA